MALANFFDKIALHAAQVLQGMDRERLEAILSSQRITLFFDENAEETCEGRATLDLSVRLLARLYPNLQIACNHNGPLKEHLTQLALSINPIIDFFLQATPTAMVVVGKTSNELEIPIYYVGSDEWVVQFSSNKPVGSADSTNPVGAGAAACFGAANLFRHVFRDQLPFGDPDEDFDLSLLDGKHDGPSDTLAFDQLHLGETLVAGLGAIGNGLAWTLSRCEGLQGTLVLIDRETVGLSNLQRYVLTDQSHLGILKVDQIARCFKDSAMNILSVPNLWGQYMEQRKNWKIETVLTCLDNAETRIMVQGALPKKIFNAWTQSENLGVSRHHDFVDDPCLCCLYYPENLLKSRSQEIADNLNLQGQEFMIRRYLANHLPVDISLIHHIAALNHLPLHELQHFVGKSLEVFFSEVVCGGLMLKYTGNTEQSNTHLVVPCAFESALAGILLAAELIKDKSGYPTNGKQSLRFNLLRPLAPYLHSPEIKRANCICTDSVFLEEYKIKWGRGDIIRL